ncbi:MAG: hypothetical protein HY741_11615 [Chloroflexi bacterium]|nr:hypothetical protein [Chloroflexota bacterium]
MSKTDERMRASVSVYPLSYPLTARRHGLGALMMWTVPSTSAAVSKQASKLDVTDKNRIGAL